MRHPLDHIKVATPHGGFDNTEFVFLGDEHVPPSMEITEVLTFDKLTLECGLSAEHHPNGDMTYFYKGYKLHCTYQKRKYRAELFESGWIVERKEKE